MKHTKLALTCVCLRVCFLSHVAATAAAAATDRAGGCTSNVRVHGDNFNSDKY